MKNPTPYLVAALILLCAMYDGGGTPVTSDGYVPVEISAGGNTADINSDGQLHVVMEGKVDTGNSTSTPLGGDAVFTGTSKETLEFAVITVSVYAWSQTRLGIQII